MTFRLAPFRRPIREDLSSLFVAVFVAVPFFALWAAFALSKVTDYDILQCIYVTLPIFFVGFAAFASRDYRLLPRSTFEIRHTSIYFGGIDIPVAAIRKKIFLLEKNGLPRSLVIWLTQKPRKVSVRAERLEGGATLLDLNREIDAAIARTSKAPEIHRASRAFVNWQNKLGKISAWAGAAGAILALLRIVLELQK